MDLLLRAIRGTISFAFEAVLPSAVGFVVGRWTRKSITGNTLKKTSGSNFLIKRKIMERKPLWRRAYHVEDETAILPIEDDGQTRDIEYVIQEHDAQRAGRHFDLRLVIKGKSVSWAIPMKGKRADLSRMPNPGEKWAAIRQPDHAVEFNKFEGRIPDGNLGAGTVKIWAAGRADIHKIEDGNVHFEIFSGPAKGKYVLVSTHDQQGILLSKNPEAVDVWTKPSYIRKDLENLRSLEASGSYVAERKVDGASVEIRVGEASRPLRTFSHRVSRRTGVLIEHTDRLSYLDGARTEGLGDTRLRAEAWHPRGVNFLSGTLNSSVDRARDVQRQAGPVQLDVFDITKYKGQDVTGLPYAERRLLYENVVKQIGSPHLHSVRQVRSGFPAFYEQQVALKKAPTDGIVVKDQSLAYNEKPWIKVKPSDLADCVVHGLAEGAGKHSGRLGALTVETPEGKAVQVGTGFSDWERQWIWNHRAEMEGEVARVDFHVRGGERTNTGPRFDSWHPDKSETSLKMYAETMDVNPYALKSAAGWRAA